MKLKKGFLTNRTDVFQFSKKQFVIGFVLFLILAISFFNFLHLIRLSGILFEALRNDFEPYFFSETGKKFYNFLFGFISVHFSFSIIYNYWFDKPNKFLSRFNYKRKFVLNQQRIMNWFFMYWFLELALVLGILSLEFKKISFYPEYKYLMFIFITAFVGQIWISIRPIIKKRKFQWFVITILIVLSSSFFISKVNFINPEKIQNKVVQNNLLYKHNVHVVESDVSTKIKRGYLSCDIVIPNEKNNQTIIFEGREINEKEFLSNIFNFREQFWDAEVPFIYYRLFIDKDVKMELIYNLKKKMNKMGANRVFFSVKKPENSEPFYYKSEYALGFHLSNNFLSSESNLEEEVYIKTLSNGNILFEEDIVSSNEIVNVLKEYFLQKGTKSLRVFIDDETRFEEYFKVLEYSKKVINELREEYSKKVYAVDYPSLNKKQRQLINKKYRWHIIDQMD